MVLLQTGSSALCIHVYVPLVGGGVEEAPAGCILRRHHAPVEATQHGHHVVLDGARDRELLQELGPAAKAHNFKVGAHFHVTKPGGAGGLFFFFFFF